MKGHLVFVVGGIASGKSTLLKDAWKGSANYMFADEITIDKLAQNKDAPKAIIVDVNDITDVMILNIKELLKKGKYVYIAVSGWGVALAISRRLELEG